MGWTIVLGGGIHPVLVVLSFGEVPVLVYYFFYLHLFVSYCFSYYFVFMFLLRLFIVKNYKNTKYNKIQHTKPSQKYKVP